MIHELPSETSFGFRWEMITTASNLVNIKSGHERAARGPVISEDKPMCEVIQHRKLLLVSI